MGVLSTNYEGKNMQMSPQQEANILLALDTNIASCDEFDFLSAIKNICELIERLDSLSNDLTRSCDARFNDRKIAEKLRSLLLKLIKNRISHLTSNQPSSTIQPPKKKSI